MYGGANLFILFYSYYLSLKKHIFNANAKFVLNKEEVGKEGEGEGGRELHSI